MTISKNKLYTIGALLALILAIVFLRGAPPSNPLEQHSSEIAPDGSTVTKLISIELAKMSTLQVFTVSGVLEIEVKAERGWGWLTSTIRSRVPYSVGYGLDLSGISSRDMDWDQKGRVLEVSVPDVRVDKPNVDEGKMQILDQSGWITTRSAHAEMRRKISKNADYRSAREASSPDRLNKARQNARADLVALLSAPLKTAGVRDVEVVVRFPFEGRRSREHWDVTRSVEDVVANHVD